MNSKVRRLLHSTGLLGPLRTVKRRLFPPRPVFAPCTPHLLVAVERSLEWVKQNLSQGPCDYLEFGIYSGFTLWYAQKIADAKGLAGMRFFGFDSFRGLPRPKGIDAEEGFFEGGHCCPRPLVETFLTQHQIDWTRTHLVGGDFQANLVPQAQGRLGLKRCGLCVIDCDMYLSAKLALEFLAPLIDRSCIVLFDDWNYFGEKSDRGERRACAEFLEEHPHLKADPFVSIGQHGQGFIFHASMERPSEDARFQRG